MSSPFDPQWRPPSPRVSGGQIGIAVAIGVGLMIVTYVAAGLVVGMAVANGPGFIYTPYPYPSLSPAPLNTGDPLAPGEPGLPNAVTPLTCAACFTEASVKQMILSDTDFVQLGLAAPDVRWDADSHQGALAEHRIDAGSWASAGFSPDDCFPTWAVTPDATPVHSEPATDDSVGRVLRTTGSAGFTVLQTARVFQNTAAATDHMQIVSEAIDSCDTYDIAGSPVDSVLAEAALPDVSLPESVAAVGLVRVLPNGERDYVMDVQRGNVVIRSTAHSTGGADDETLFRELMAEQATQMAAAAVG